MFKVEKLGVGSSQKGNRAMLAPKFLYRRGLNQKTILYFN